MRVRSVAAPAAVAFPSSPRLLRLLERGFPERALRPSQTIMLAQRLSGIGCTKQSTTLQQWDDLPVEGVQHRRQHRGHDVEAIRRAVGKPVFDKVGDLLGRASKREM